MWLLTRIDTTLSTSSARRIATHVTSGHLHVDGFKTGAEKSFKVSRVVSVVRCGTLSFR